MSYMCYYEQGGGFINKSLLIRLARMYYEQNMNQQQIGNEVGLSRMAVSRLLQKARDLGIVNITINYKGGYTELEDEIKAKYKLKEAIITPYEEGERLKELLCEATISLFQRVLKDGDIVGVGWGSTLTYLQKYIDVSPDINATFVPLLGGYGDTKLEMHANQIASNLARVFGGESHLLHAPAMVDNIDLKNMLIADKNIRFILELAEKANKAIIGIGAPFGQNTTIHESGYFKKEDIEELRRAEVECDIVSCIYLNREGKECKLDLLKRTIGISAEKLKKIPEVIAVAGGESKQKAIKLAIKTGSVNIIVTDEKTGQALLAD